MSYAIDTHCHLHLMPDSARADVLKRAEEAGVKKFVNVACTIDEIQQCLPFVGEHDFMWTTAGIHPTELSDSMEDDLRQVYDYAKSESKVVAIGEIGIDYYHDKFPSEVQKNYLRGQLKIATELNKPAVIHSRSGKWAGDNSSAFKDLIQIFKEERFSNGVMHCFSGNQEEAKELLRLGFLLSFTGIITYDRNQELRDIIKEMSWDQMMIETDSPFLTPKKYRSQKNEPAYVIEVAKMIADVKGVELEKVLDETSKNAERFFGI